MGAIADRSFNMYGTGKDQIDIAKQMRLSGYINPKDQIGITIASQLPSIFMSLAQKIVDVCGDYNSEFSDGELSELGEEIQAQITEILGTHGCESIQDLEDTYNQYNDKLNDENKNIKKQENTFEKNNQRIDDNITAIRGLKEQIYTLQESLNNTELPVEERTEIKDKIEKLNKQIKAKEDENSRLKDANTEAQNSIQKSKKEIEEISPIVDDLKSALDEVNKLATNLRRNDGQDGRDVIKNMCNDDTNSICELVRELSKTTDETQKTELENSLKSALNEYTQNHKQEDSKTINLLLKKYNITWPTGSTEK